MQPYPIFFPNYPPPILTRESIINEGLKAFEQSKNDQQWINNWIENRRKSSKQISLTDYRQKLIEHSHLLRQYDNALKESNHQILVELKIQIEQANDFLYDDNAIKHIQKQIHRRKSKRARLRRQKQTKDEIIELQPSPSINEKIQDIQSILRTIEQLQTIRQQRQKDNIVNSNDQLIEIQNICTAKLLEYQNQMKGNSQSCQIELYNYLFNNHNQSFYQSTNSDGQYLLRAHQNKNDLIQIRQGWDQYASTNRSSSDNIIPLQWHEPQLPSDSNWTRYIFNKKE
jgi:hypothetical protein